LRLASDASWRLLVIAAAVLAVVLLVARLQFVLIPVFIALLLSTALAPPVRWLERRRVPTAAATAMVFVVFIGVLAGITAAIVPPVVDEFADLGPTLEEAADDIEEWLVDGPLDLKRRDVTDFRDNFGDRVGDALGITSGGIVRGARTAGEVVAGTILALVLTFFFVKDARVFQRWALRRVPVDRREIARTSATKAYRTLQGYLLGATMIGAIEGVVIGVTVALAGGTLVIPIMVLTFFGAFLPIVGAVVAGIVAILITLVAAGFAPAVVVTIVVILVQQFDTDLLAPLVYGRTVNLHPVVVLVALTAGGSIAGIVGAFVAVPVTAVVVAIGGEFWRRRTEADPRFTDELP
jgi:predicted PurR-regulated permease PerM